MTEPRPHARRRRLAALRLAAALTLAGAGMAGAQQRQPIDSAFERRADELEKHLKSCDAQASGGQPTGCNVLVARGLHTLYGLDDFGPGATGRYRTAAEIRAAVPASGRWRQLGAADSPEMLEAACALVNDRSTAVIAVSPGHVALLLPGRCRLTAWGRRVPLAASYVANRPASEAFIGLPLSQAWTRADRPNVKIWARATAQ